MLDSEPQIQPLLDVVDTLKGDFNISGVATLTSYSGFGTKSENTKS